MKRIFTYGCSFTSWRWPTWPHILQHALPDYQVNDRAFEGKGNIAILHDLLEDDLKHKFTEDDIILIVWTGWTREDRFHDGVWLCDGNIHTGDTHSKEFIENYWSMSNDIMKNTSAIVMANRLFNINHQAHAFDYDDLTSNPAQFRFYEKQKISVDYDFSHLIDALPEKLLFNTMGTQFDNKTWDKHPDILSQLQHATEIMQSINMQVPQETIEFFEQQQQKVITELTNTNGPNQDWNEFRRVFADLFPECTPRFRRKQQ